MPAYGRIPSPPDARDYDLKFFLGDEDPLQQLLNAMVANKGANPAVKAWAKVATARIIGSQPSPTPNPPQPSKAVYWDNPRDVLDQGDYGTCVGNGWAQWGNTSPVNDSYTEGMGESAIKGGDFARAIYYEATVFDGQPDDPDASGGGQQGATVRSGAKAMQKRGKISAYASAKTVDDAVAWVQAKGPVVVGTWFTNDMEEPDSSGLVHPTGGNAGGHCYVMDGYDPDTQKIKFLNSWSDGWGDKGYFYMYKNEFESLFEQDGEAWTAIELTT